MEVDRVEKKAIAIGPWGGHGGTNWDDKSYSGIREITLTYGSCIDSISITYDMFGKPVVSTKHGGVGGVRTAQIKLQFPEEMLTSVSGHICPVVYGGSPVIRSITFKSNKRTFGAFGVEEGMPFSLPMEGGYIVGFKGRSGWYLDAIGFYISRVKPPKIVQFTPEVVAPEEVKPIATPTIEQVKLKVNEATPKVEEIKPKIAPKAQSRFRRLTSTISFANQKNREQNRLNPVKFSP